MPTTNLFRLGLHEVSKRLRDGRLKPSVYISSLLERINELEGSVQAWQWLDRDRALNIAKKADSAAGALRAAHPLYGIPIGVKDNIFTAGIPTEMGACLYQNFIPERSADLVDRIEKSGAFVFGKTVTTEAAFMFPRKLAILGTCNILRVGHQAVLLLRSRQGLSLELLVRKPMGLSSVLRLTAVWSVTK